MSAYDQKRTLGTAFDGIFSVFQCFPVIIPPPLLTLADEVIE
jgi:hypothetical protein